MSTLRVNTLQEADGTAFPLGVRASDQWRVTSDFISNNTNPISSNWERVDTDGFGQLATGMTQSSGVFTFP